MKLTITRESLLSAMKAAEKVVERRNTLPILANVLLRAEGNTLSITATDLDCEVVLDAHATVDKPGETTVVAQILKDFAGKLSDGAEISLTVDKTSMRISSGRWRATMQTLPATDFPSMAAGEFSHTGEWRELPDLLGAVDFAISTEETRYYLNGVFVHVSDDGAAAAVATDGHRLGRILATAPEGLSGMPGVIIPRKSVALIQALFSGAEELTFSASDTKIAISSDSKRFLSKVIDGTFPDYQRVIPNGNPHCFKFDVDTLRYAADRVVAIWSERGRAVKFNFQADSILLEAVNPDAGDTHDEAPCDGADEAVSIGFNGRYWIDAMQALGPGDAEIHLNDAGSPAVLTRPGSDRTLVLMPMRV